MFCCEVGNDGLDQLMGFNKALEEKGAMWNRSNPRGIDGIVLTKYSVPRVSYYIVPSVAIMSCVQKTLEVKPRKMIAEFFLKFFNFGGRRARNYCRHALERKLDQVVISSRILSAYCRCT